MTCSVISGQVPQASQGRAPLVSVIVPVYNHRGFLPHRLASIYAQTYQWIEVICIDDASSDGSGDYLESIQQHWGFSLVRNEKRNGVPLRQWARGVSCARGEFIWIAEGDDSALPQFLSTMISALDRFRDAAFAVCESMYIDEKGRWIGGSASSDPAGPDLVHGPMHLSEQLVHRNTIPNVSACVFRAGVLNGAKMATTELILCGDWLCTGRSFPNETL